MNTGDQCAYVSQMSKEMDSYGRSRPDRACYRVLLVEHRDEVFARLCSDLEGRRFGVVRASTADMAARFYATFACDIALCNEHLPDASGWLLACKLHTSAPLARIWLYASQGSVTDLRKCQLAGVEQLIFYGGDLFRLADEVIGRLTRNEPPSSTSDRAVRSEHPPLF